MGLPQILCCWEDLPINSEPIQTFAVWIFSLSFFDRCIPKKSFLIIIRVLQDWILVQKISPQVDNLKVRAKMKLHSNNVLSISEAMATFVLWHLKD